MHLPGISIDIYPNFCFSINLLNMPVTLLAFAGIIALQIALSAGKVVAGADPADSLADLDTGADRSAGGFADRGGLLSLVYRGRGAGVDGAGHGKCAEPDPAGHLCRVPRTSAAQGEAAAEKDPD